MARQGVALPSLAAMQVGDADTGAPVPRDGATHGRGDAARQHVMKGYLEDRGHREAFLGGWFHTGDLGVWHADNYIEIKDRAKDIIISGGENILAGGRGMPLPPSARHGGGRGGAAGREMGRDAMRLRHAAHGMSAPEKELITFCRQHLAGYKVPRTVVFGPLPKTSTGKVQKYVLRDHASEL